MERLVLLIGTLERELIIELVEQPPELVRPL